MTGAPSPYPSGGREREVHVGRQPLYDRSGHLVAYELLFRGAHDARHANVTDDDAATTTVILNTFTEFGLHQLVGPRLALVNLTRPFITGALAIPFEPTQTVLEILETVAVDAEVVAGARRLTERGYALALDDFVWHAAAEPLVALASYVKIDILAGPPGQAAETLARCRRYRVQAVAERVETAEQLGWCRELGFDLFQGYHLGRPQVISERALAPAQVTGLRLLSELSRPDLTMEELEAYVMRDPALSYRTLRAANSVASGLPRKLRSVRSALVLLGLRRLRSWIILMTICDTMPAGEEDLLSTVIRARACEQLARQSGLVDGDEAFTVGLLSGLADLLGVAPEAVADRLDLDDDMAAALTGDAGRPLGEVLAAMLAHEAGDLDALAGSRFDLGPVSHAYLSAVDWSRLVHEAFIPSPDTLRTAPA